MTTEKVRLFYSYAHEDEGLRNQLDIQMRVLARKGLIDPWHDREIRGGEDWAHEIDIHLQAAHIILLLISPDFIASDYLYSVEMGEALRKHERGEAHIIPVIVRPCNWQEISALKSLQALPKSALPATSWANRDEVFTEIVHETGIIVMEIYRRINNVQEMQVPPPLRVRFPSLIPHSLQKPAIYWTRFLSTMVTALCIDIMASGFGFHTWEPAPLFNVVERNLGPSILLGSFFILIGIMAWMIAGVPKKPEKKLNKTDSSTLTLPQRLIMGTLLSTMSMFLCFILLAVVLLRPPWCPNTLCLSPQPVLNPNGNSDGTLEVYFTTLQSATFVIPSKPLSYTLANLPDQIGAFRIDQKVQNPYRIVFNVHSLQHGHYGMFIDQITLVVDDTPPLPHPLNVWDKSSSLDYRSDPFNVTYSGESAGTPLTAVYTPLPAGQMQLNPGESDEVDLQVISRVTVNLRFHIQITYRVTNENEIRTVRLPGSFEVAFSDASNWHQYHLEDGHFAAS